MPPSCSASEALTLTDTPSIHPESRQTVGFDIHPGFLVQRSFFESVRITGNRQPTVYGLSFRNVSPPQLGRPRPVSPAFLPPRLLARSRRGKE